MKGFDQQTNLILEQTLERVFTRNGQEATGNQEEQAPEEEMGSSQLVPLGLYLVRGDNMYYYFITTFYFSFFNDERLSISALVGSMNEELEDQIDWTQVYADPLPALRV